jgi:hypothetical protein
MHTTHTIAEMAITLNRPVVEVSGLQNRFDHSASGGAGYSDA